MPAFPLPKSSNSAANLHVDIACPSYRQRLPYPFLRPAILRVYERGVEMKATQLESPDIKAQAQGRWIEILQFLAPELDLAIERKGRHVACPMHDSPDGFRVFQDVAATGGAICSSCGAFHDGFALLQALKGWDFPETLLRVAEALGGEGSVSAPLPRRNKERDEAAERRREKEIRYALRQRWSEGRKDAGAYKLVADYLSGRGISPGVADLWMAQARVHPNLPLLDDEGNLLGRWPCVMTLVKNAADEAVTIHRTWLQRVDNALVTKAPVANPRKMFPVVRRGALSGSAIRLGEPLGATLSLAEGIETALAVTAATGMATWACWSASLMPKFEVPDGIDVAVIWADKDAAGAGLKAARELQQRLWSEGVKAAVQLPPASIPVGAKSIDWADVYSSEKHLGPMSLLI